MVNRRNTVYYTLPEQIAPGKQKDAKLTVSFGAVVPKEMEKKVQKFMDNMHDDIAKAFKKFMDKQCDKLMDD